MDEKSLIKVISGGQTGVDQAALRAARDAGLAIGGWCPPGRLCESGPIPSEFPLVETPDERSERAPDVPRSRRTEWNVKHSDATLIISPLGLEAGDPGTDWAAQCARRYRRPMLRCDPDDAAAKEEIVAWLIGSKVATLGVGGPSESSAPGIGVKVYELLIEVFRESPARVARRAARGDVGGASA